MSKFSSPETVKKVANHGDTPFSKNVIVYLCNETGKLHFIISQNFTRKFELICNLKRTSWINYLKLYKYFSNKQKGQQMIKEIRKLRYFNNNDYFYTLEECIG